LKSVADQGFDLTGGGRVGVDYVNGVDEGVHSH